MKRPAMTMGPGWQEQGEIMQLQEIMTQEVEVICPDATLQEAAQHQWRGVLAPGLAGGLRAM